jgi:hypothetical protein
MCMMGVDDPSFVALYTTLAAEGVCVIGVEFCNSAGGLIYGPDAPLAPFPAGINDCTSGLQYVFDNKEELAVTTIVVSGESGGGNLSSALALKTKRENRGPLIDGVCKRSRSLCVFFRSSREAAAQARCARTFPGRITQRHRSSRRSRRMPAISAGSPTRSCS